MQFEIGGHAKDYIIGMWKMMQHKVGDDYVLATGKTQSVRKFCFTCI